MRSTILYGLLFLLFVGCIEPPVKQKENSYSISKRNIKSYCHKLEKHFPDYSCKEYFKKSFKVKDGDESIEIELNKEKLILIYKTETRKNEDLFKLYNDLNEAL